jgi:penicillin-binding protein 1B
VAIKLKTGGPPRPQRWTEVTDGDDPPPSGRRRNPGARMGFGEALLRIALISAGIVTLVVFAVFFYYYHQYSGVVDQWQQGPIFAATAKIYAGPREVRPGQRFTAAQIAGELRSAGYADSENQKSQLGTFRLIGDSISINPGPQSFHAPDGATITTANGMVSQINSDSGQPLAAYALEPALITGLSDDKDRSKRRIVTFSELPPNVVQSVLAIEDRRFFEHGGINYGRMAEAAMHDLARGNKSQGASTLTMQLAKLFFLSPEKRWKRKFIQVVITLQLEHRFSKQKIFEMYANAVNLGQRGSFSIDGFGEAAQAYFGKDVRQLDLAQCALLAGMIQSPSRLNPMHHPERAMERRNLVLDAMVETGAVTAAEAERAKAEPLHLSANSVDAGEAPYFVDLVREQLMQKLGDRDFNREGLRIYTTLDPDLQRMATDAVTVGMEHVDELVRKRDAKKPEGTSTFPQVALIALNPHTGEVLALVGGRSYGTSQLDHAVAKRPTGSIFKPFVYATAFNSSLGGNNLPGRDAVFTQATILSDDEATYTTAGGQAYTPRDYHGESFGQVTARFALQKSLNRATISLGSMVGFGNVAALAREAGVKAARGTPSVSIGAYDATPLDMAGAYTIFANSGVHINPFMVASVRNTKGDPVEDYTAETRSVLDPRVAYLVTNMLENVINSGTGAVVRGMGFEAPAAGKTGTSHDAWFAGYTSNLLCIIWVGNDDYTDIEIEGAKAAAPIWAEFMKRAITLPQYSDVKPFSVPQGIEMVTLDKATNLLADETCPEDYTAAFLVGTAPTESCEHADVDQNGLQQRVFTMNGTAPPPTFPSADGPSVTSKVPILRMGVPQPGAPPEQPKKKGFFGRIFGGGNKNSLPPPPSATPPTDAPDTSTQE